jgi:hypothetical protein
MSKPNIQIDDEIREMTDEEFANFKIVQKQMEAIQTEADAETQIRKSAFAKLAKLGLTENEINAIIGEM